LVTVRPRDFQRTISIPAVLVDRPGRSEIAVSAPMTGIVERVYPIQGEAVLPGDPLFDLRLTHEDLVEKQSELLRALEELDVVRREVTRLEKVTASGAVPGTRLLERQYEQQKIEAAIRAERQALVLHGLTDEQIEKIVEDRRLLPSLTIAAPPGADGDPCGNHEELLQVAAISVSPGEHVTAGTRLGTLADHCRLYVEGKAFEHDADALNEAANDGVPVTAVVEGNGSGGHEVPGLRILYVENQVEMESRALKFYVRLPNELVRNEKTPEGHHFVGWRYRPGQRVDVLVPVERWKGRIVLPAEAVVQEGAERFVYRQVGDHFDRRAVHVEHRDRQWAVIESDGTLLPGDVVAGKGAYQIHLALKKKAGGGVDPHAGHQHH
jgi:multidrug efflux pump subunit AcrA (membrane-fusion protein)